MAVKPVYASPATVTLTCANLASSASLIAGRESTAVSNASTRYVDVGVYGRLRVNTSPTPTANTAIAVYAWAERPPSGWTEADAAASLSHTGQYSGLALLGAATVSATATLDYDFVATSLVALFGYMPNKWGLWVTQNTGQVLLNNSVNNDAFTFIGMTYEDV
jgi:hypothetical protein